MHLVRPESTGSMNTQQSKICFYQVDEKSLVPTGKCFYSPYFVGGVVLVFKVDSGMYDVRVEGAAPAYIDKKIMCSNWTRVVFLKDNHRYFHLAPGAAGGGYNGDWVLNELPTPLEWSRATETQLSVK